MNLAFSNVCEFININSERPIILDSTIMGMGQGAGNVQTELVAHHLNKLNMKKYNYSFILEACELIENFGREKYGDIRL